MAEGPMEAWRRLRSTGLGDGTFEVPTISTDTDSGYGLVLFALGPRNQPRLLIPCGARPARALADRSPNLVLRHSSFKSPGNSATFIDLMTEGDRLDSVFAEVVAQILARLEKGETPEGAVLGTLSDFRELLAAPRAEPEDATIVGLIGELLVLERLVNIDAGAIATWLGPSGQRHDFRNRQMAIETKTSTRSDATRIMIHGPEQLWEPADGHLWLAHVRLEPSANGRETVSSITKRILSKVTDPAPFHHCLDLVGCADPSDPGWNRRNFGLEGLELYLVCDGFPRIGPASFPGEAMPTGVGNLRYSIDLSVASKHLVPAEKTPEVFKEFLS